VTEPETRGGGPVVGEPAPAGWFVGPSGDPDRLQLLGEGIRGGEGTLWQARYRGRLSTPLTRAVKQLRPPAGAGPGWPTPEDLRRWEDQKVLLQHLRVDHLVTVYDVFLGPLPHRAGAADPDGSLVPYVEMEWVPGSTVSRLVGGAPATRASLPQRLRWVTDLAAALHTMHSQTRAGGNPVLHRDVKPANCIVSPERGLVLVDVSTVRPLADGRDPDGRHTPGYTAPEVLRDPYAPRSPASEAYALGALACYCLTGTDPGPAPDRVALRRAARRAGVGRPSAFTGLLLSALDPDPLRRPADLSAWAASLRQTAAPRRTTTVAAALLAVAAVAATTVLLATRDDRPQPPIGAPSPTGGGTRTTTAPSASLLPLPGGGAAYGDGRSSVPAGGSSSATSTRPSSAPPAVTPLGAITAPANAGTVPRCSYLQGTARIPAGMTLLLVAANQDNSDTNEYLQPVFDHDTAASRTAWRGAQFFGNESDSIGQHYRVELRYAPLTMVDARLADPANRPSWSEPRTSHIGTTLAAITVQRVAGDGDFPCDPPAGVH
jgi:eukaryotic-like serine/threonine-protein kinase